MKRCKINAILNITPDSIDNPEDENHLSTPEQTLAKASLLIANGADNLDIGGQATNPWAKPISPEEEWTRLEPVIGDLIDKYPGRIILDTFNVKVAEKALSIGKISLNDVTMFHGQGMIDLAVEHKVICYLGHLPLEANGSIIWAHNNPKMDSEIDVLEELLIRRRQMINRGVKPEKIIIDPDIGFGKTPRLNRRLLEFSRLTHDRMLLHNLDPECLEEPVIKVEIGHSQKRMIEQFFGGDKKDSNANIAAGKIAVNSGASYIRVHKPELYRVITG